MSRSGRPDRPARTTARPAGSSGQPAKARPTVALVPLESRRSRFVTAGLLTFVTGFAAGAVESLVTGRTGLLYLLGISLGLAGIGLTGAFLNRGTVPRPEAPLWRPDGLRPWLAGAGLPVLPTLVAFYLLLAVGIVGNFLVPLFFGR